MTPAQKLIDEAAERIAHNAPWREGSENYLLAFRYFVAAEIGKVVEEATKAWQNYFKKSMIGAQDYCKKAVAKERAKLEDAQIEAHHAGFLQGMKAEREAIAKWVAPLYLESNKGRRIEYGEEVAQAIRARGKGDGE